METVTIENVTLELSHPTELPGRWVGQQELMLQVLAAWTVLNEDDQPLNPRLLGKPGVGKTTLAYAAAKEIKRDTWLMQATMDTRPEDLLVTPVVSSEGKIKYVASPVVTAMLKGGVVILDEGNRMSEKAWASLAPLLDQRRYIESIVAGLKVEAHRDFRFVVTMNDDSSTFELPEYIHSRLQPMILIDFPEADEELQILKENVPFAPEEVLEYVVGFLMRAHTEDAPYTVRDGINVARYALKLVELNRPLPKALAMAVKMILGEDGLVYVGKH